MIATGAADWTSMLSVLLRLPWPRLAVSPPFLQFRTRRQRRGVSKKLAHFVFPPLLDVIWLGWQSHHVPPREVEIRWVLFLLARIYLFCIASCSLGNGLLFIPQKSPKSTMEPSFSVTMAVFHHLQTDRPPRPLDHHIDQRLLAGFDLPHPNSSATAAARYRPEAVFGYYHHFFTSWWHVHAPLS